MCCRKNGAIHSNRDTKSFIKNNDAELYDYLCGVVDLSEYDDNIKEVILCILYDGFSSKMSHSLNAVARLAKENGAKVCEDLNKVVQFLNTRQLVEDSNK